MPSYCILYYDNIIQVCKLALNLSLEIKNQPCDG